MKIAVTANEPKLASEIDARFGRCAYFIIYDTQSNTFTAVTNDAANDTMGAGSKAAEIIRKHGAELLLTGKVGPKALTALNEAGIRFVEDVSGTVSSAIEHYRGATAA